MRLKIVSDGITAKVVDEESGVQLEQVSSITWEASWSGTRATLYLLNVPVDIVVDEPAIVHVDPVPFGI